MDIRAQFGIVTACAYKTIHDGKNGVLAGFKVKAIVHHIFPGNRMNAIAIRGINLQVS